MNNVAAVTDRFPRQAFVNSARVRVPSRVREMCASTTDLARGKGGGVRDSGCDSGEPSCAFLVWIT